MDADMDNMGNQADVAVPWYKRLEVSVSEPSLLPLSPRGTVAFISIISMISCTVDISTTETHRHECCEATNCVESLRLLLLTLFQMANLLLLLASMVEISLLVQVYVWYTMSFVLLGLAVALADFLLRVRREGATRAMVVFVPEIAFLFVIFRCLPIVDKYGRDIEGETVFH